MKPWELSEGELRVWEALSYHKVPVPLEVLAFEAFPFRDRPTRIQKFCESIDWLERKRGLSIGISDGGISLQNQEVRDGGN